jgi:beta-galactosidase/beta-glucuronidase
VLADGWREQDLRMMLRRDRNHPSVVMWSIGNEVGEQTRGETGRRSRSARSCTKKIRHGRPQAR